MFSINTTTEYNLTVFDNTTSRYDNAFVEKMNHVISLSLIVVTFIAMMSLGCTVEVSKIKKYLIKPKGVAIAAVAQYGIMPLTAFCLAKLIVMTTCSTVWAWHHYILILILVPCGVGILINYHFPKYSKIITKVGISVMLILFVVIGVVAGVIDGNRVFRVTAPPLLATAALMPMIGYICGYILSTLFKMNASCRRTIAIETGCQNIQLCTTILKVAFPAEVIGQLYLFPVVYIVFQVVEAFSWYFIPPVYRPVQTTYLKKSKKVNHFARCTMLVQKLFCFSILVLFNFAYVIRTYRC
ncbi:putative sodium/bile acid cotransporter [Triplophysa rosa]|uniref:Sodium/bile acid cotransporter n=1 Tax=Triplophysa rosa TaxID=992332 RepID=A0A9W7WHQ8_TRIRA|nr:putative sodium/bile acid cotransporter [Triplophysa rosa]